MHLGAHFARPFIEDCNSTSLEQLCYVARSNENRNSRDIRIHDHGRNASFVHSLACEDELHSQLIKIVTQLTANLTSYPGLLANAGKTLS
jgi:hypothetical protein